MRDSEESEESFLIEATFKKPTMILDKHDFSTIRRCKTANFAEVPFVIQEKRWKFANKKE